MSSKLADLISDLRVELADFIPALRSQSKLRMRRSEPRSETVFLRLYKLLTKGNNSLCVSSMSSFDPHGKQLESNRE